MSLAEGLPLDRAAERDLATAFRRSPRLLATDELVATATTRELDARATWLQPRDRT